MQHVTYLGNNILYLIPYSLGGIYCAYVYCMLFRTAENKSSTQNYCILGYIDFDFFFNEKVGT